MQTRVVKVRDYDLATARTAGFTVLVFAHLWFSELRKLLARRAGVL